MNIQESAGVATRPSANSANSDAQEVFDPAHPFICRQVDTSKKPPEKKKDVSDSSR
jgi:hypothetical protein